MPYLLIFYRLIVRPLRSEPLRTLLTAAAVALGVAVVLAIELAGNAAAGSFHSSMETLTGDADLEVTATGGLSPDVWSRLAALPYPLRFEPRIEDFGEIAGTDRSVKIVGVDLLSSEKDALLAGPSLGYKIGDRLKLAANDTEQEFFVRGELAKGSGDTVAMDLATASNFLGRDRLDRILVHTPAGKTLEQWQSILAAASGATVA